MIKPALVVLVAASIVMLSFNISSASSYPGNRGMFFMQTAPTGEIDAQGSSGVFRLMLESPSSSTITVSDKAFPVVGSQETVDFVSSWNSSLYYPVEPPQAALFIASDPGKIYVMQLSNPQLGEIFSSNYISYNVTSFAFTNSTEFPVNANQTTPVQWSGSYRMAFEQATLLISANHFVRGPDADGDGINDYDEMHTYHTDPRHSDSERYGNDSEDSLPDLYELNVTKTDPLKSDTDMDGLTDSQEVHMYGTNPLLADTDADGIGDGHEVGNMDFQLNPRNADTDGDGLTDGFEWASSADSNPLNPLMYDTDRDGFNDKQDNDLYQNIIDGDGIPASIEVNVYGTDPDEYDTDSDHLSDALEIFVLHTDPLVADTDGDGINDSDEWSVHHTDPTKADSDGDGASDYDELNLLHTDPWYPG